VRWPDLLATVKNGKPPRDASKGLILTWTDSAKPLVFTLQG
jgi:hypothetical protein